MTSPSKWSFERRAKASRRTAWRLGARAAAVAGFLAANFGAAQAASARKPSPSAPRPASEPAAAFTLAPWNAQGNFIEYYQGLSAHGEPALITVDSALWALQRLREELLGALEINVMLPRLGQALDLAATRAQQLQAPEPLAEPLRQARLYLAVARALLDPKAALPADLADSVRQELARIEAHAGFAFSCVLDQKMDYSQMQARGRYTQTDELRRYFQAQMWLSRTLFRLDETHPDGAGVPLDHPELQGWFPPEVDLALAAKGNETALAALAQRFPPQGLNEMRAAALLAICMDQADPGKASAGRLLDEIDDVLKWLFGPSDDPGLREARTGLRAVFGAAPTIADLSNQAKVLQWAAWLGQQTHPKIDSTGLGRRGVSFLGQRSVFDSQILQMMVAGDAWPARYAPSPSASKPAQDPFTLVRDDPRGPLRGFPRGLDVFAAAGGGLAGQLLQDMNDAAYEGFDKRLAEARQAWDRHFGKKATGLTPYDDALAAAAKLAQPPSGARLPAWMRTPQYARLRLNTALAAWAVLRHEAILYAKQSYGRMVGAGAILIREGPPVYVEPRPDLYKLLADGAARAAKFAEAHSADLPGEMVNNARVLHDLLASLEAASQAELKGAPIRREDASRIGRYGDALRGALKLNPEYAARIAVDLKGPVAVAADVHTRAPLCLEEAVGPLWEMTAPIGAGPDQRPYKGAVYSYYEFKQPIAQRLTDEQWRAMLNQNQAPAPLLLEQANDPQGPATNVRMAARAKG